MRPLRWTLLISALLVAATLAVYWPTRNYGFIPFDDNVFVTENPYVLKGLTWEGVKGVFRSSSAGFWGPLTMVSHLAVTQLFGLDAGWNHLVNAWLHAFNALLLFVVLRSMTGALWKAALVAFVFALHPLRVESVAWVSERKDVLSVFFAMLTLWAYLRYCSRPGLIRYLLTAFLFVLGLLSKPMLVTLPFLFLLLDYWPLGRLRFRGGPEVLPEGKEPRWKTPSNLLFEKVPLILLSAAAGAVTIWFHLAGDALAPLGALPLGARFANAAVSYVAYLGMMIRPADLTVFYPHPVTVPFFRFSAALLLLSLITYLVLRPFRRQAYLAAGWLWYLISLVPVIGLVQAGAQAMADRYTYLPHIGISIMVAWGAETLCDRYSVRKWVPAVLGGCVVSAFLFAAMLQLRHWENGVTLFRHAVRVNPADPDAHAFLGTGLAASREHEAALLHLREALRIDPENLEANNSIGILLSDQGKVDEAIAHFRTALGVRPRLAKVHNNLGVAFSRKGRLDKAVSSFQEALDIDPHYADAMNNLARTYAQLGRLDEAIEQQRRAVLASPGNAFFIANLGHALAARGDPGDAEEAFRKAVSLSPRAVPSAYNGLATLYAGRGRYKEALEFRRLALELDPRNAEARYRAAVEYYLAGHYDQAAAHLREAMGLGYKGVEKEFLSRMERFREEREEQR